MAPLEESLSTEELRDAWFLLSHDDRAWGLRSLPRAEAEDFFFSLSARDQAELIAALPLEERRSWMRLLPPDDAADLIQESEPEDRDALLDLLNRATRREVVALLAYAEDEAGGLMNPRFARVRPEMTVDAAISYLRRQTLEYLETIYYIYVLDEQQKLLGVVSFRELFAAAPTKLVRDVMETDIVTVTDDLDQESVSRVFAEHDLLAAPVVDADGRMKGIVTVDDIVDVVEEEATEDIQKIGGMEALDAPYLETGFWALIRKRIGWLTALFLSEMLTTSAMGRFQSEIEKFSTLALFVPLIVSSGGNSGSQASTLVIRAMSLDEVRLRDWWRVMRREVMSGLAMGAILGVIGMIRILVWQYFFHTYQYPVRVGLTICVSLLGVVVSGTTAGSLLPFILRRLKFDPASASAPFVATLVDVSGIIIYFEVAHFFLKGVVY